MIQFTCDKDKFVNAITVTSRTVSQKSTIAALEGIHLSAGAVICMTGYDMETAVTVTFEADIKEMGSAIFPAKLMSDIVRKLPDDTVKVTVDDNYRVRIESGISTFSIMAIAADEYPELPDVEFDKAVYLPQNILRDMLGGTIFAVSDNSSRPIQTGCKFEIDKETLTVIAVDGYRLAMRREVIDNPEDRVMNFVVPAPALRELEKILLDTDDNMAVTLGMKHIMFQVGSATLICRLLVGEFLDWKRVLPTDNPIRVCMDVKTAISALDRVSLIISEKNKSPVRFTIGNDVLVMRTSNALGNAYDECVIAGDGKDIEIGFNAKFMMEALKAIPADSFMLELKTNLSPAVLRPVEGEKFTYMVLPVRMRAE